MSSTFKYSEPPDPIAELVKINPVPSLLVEMKDLEIVVINNAACKLLGYSEKQLLNKSILVLVPDEDHKAVRRAAEEPAPEGETLWRCVRNDLQILFLKLKYRETIYRGQAARFIVVTETSEHPF